MTEFFFDEFYWSAQKAQLRAFMQKRIVFNSSTLEKNLGKPLGKNISSLFFHSQVCQNLRYYSQTKTFFFILFTSDLNQIPKSISMFLTKIQGLVSKPSRMKYFGIMRNINRNLSHFHSQQFSQVQRISR